MSGNQYQEEDQIPSLIPLKKVKAYQIPVATPSQKNSIHNDELRNVLIQSLKETPTNIQNAKDADKNAFPAKKQPNPTKIEEIQKKAKQKISTVQKKDNQLKNMQMEKSKETEKSKFFITQMLNAINVKNLSEELYPVSNQQIQQLLSGIEKQIAELHVDADKKQRTLAINQNNLHLKKELETVRREIDHCCLIKQLYYEKMQYRNKIQTLEEDIINLREETKELKIKVSRGLEALENYKQNLPTNNEKELKEKLNKCMQELNEQKDMRQSLQKNIETIINNFKRLYDEADLARQIVTKKLKELEERQRRLRKSKQISDEDGSQQVTSPLVKRVATLQVTEKQKQLTSSFSDFNNTHNLNMSKKMQTPDQDSKKSTAVKPKYPIKQEKQKTSQKPLNMSTNLTLQQKIRKMRGNQTALTMNKFQK